MVDEWFIIHTSLVIKKKLTKQELSEFLML